MAASDMKAPATVEIEVAWGRTVIHDGTSYGPGKTVSVPKDVADALRATGFVADPDAPPVQRIDDQTVIRPR